MFKKNIIHKSIENRKVGNKILKVSCKYYYNILDKQSFIISVFLQAILHHVVDRIWPASHHLDTPIINGLRNET